MTATTFSADAISSFTSAFASDTSTCAKPGCQTVITLAESLYIDGCGQVCPACDPVPDDLAELMASGFQPPY